MQVIDAIEDRVQKVALSVLQGQNAVQGGRERKAIRDHVEFQGRGLIAAQYLMVSLPAFPVLVQMIPFLNDLPEIFFCAGCFLQTGQSFPLQIPLQLFDGRRIIGIRAEQEAVVIGQALLRFRNIPFLISVFLLPGRRSHLLPRRLPGQFLFFKNSSAMMRKMNCTKQRRWLLAAG